MTDIAGVAIPGAATRVIGMLYSVSALSLFPLGAAIIAAAILKRRNAGERALIWRSAIIVLLVVLAGEVLPFQLKAWIVPQELASPFIVFGRAQLAVLEQLASHSGEGFQVQWVLWVWLLGVGVIASQTASGLLRLRYIAREATEVREDALLELLAEARRTAGVRRSVRLLVSARTDIPITWGVLRPIVLLPPAARRWAPEHLHAALLHELHHVRHADALFALAARAVCTLYWFNPLTWWMAHRLEVESELACDDRVLSTGVRRSDYAEVLSGAGHGGALASGARALGGPPGGVRERLRRVVDTGRTVRLPTRMATTIAAGITFFLSLSVSLVQLVPTREVLTTLMQDDRWEARAYAVVRLAERADSVEVARAAARTDPNPRVRAWARYALAQLPPRDLFIPPSPKL